MKTKLIRWLAVTCGLGLTCVVLDAHGTSAFSEPDLTVYGKVFNSSLGPDMLASAGEIQWTFTAADSSETVVTTNVEAIGGSAFNYRLEVPVQIQLAGFSLADRSLKATPTDADYTLTVTVDGQTATLTQADTTPFSGPLTFAEIRRGTFARIDLHVAGEVPDSDFDGMPDFWEERYAPITNLNNPLDGLDDMDGDGVPNLEEFLNGTAPDCYEWTQWLAQNTLPEGDLSLSAADADPDEDSICNAMEYALGGDPRTADCEVVLARSRVELAEDPITGEQYLTLTVTRPAHRQCAIDYVVETSNDLINWDSDQDVDVHTLLEDATQIRVRDTQYMGEPGTDRRFIRLSLVTK